MLYTLPSTKFTHFPWFRAKCEEDPHTSHNLYTLFIIPLKENVTFHSQALRDILINYETGTVHLKDNPIF